MHCSTPLAHCSCGKGPNTDGTCNKYVYRYLSIKPNRTLLSHALCISLARTTSLTALADRRSEAGSVVAVRSGPLPSSGSSSALPLSRSARAIGPAALAGSRLTSQPTPRTTGRIPAARTPAAGPTCPHHHSPAGKCLHDTRRTVAKQHADRRAHTDSSAMSIAPRRIPAASFIFFTFMQ